MVAAYEGGQYKDRGHVQQVVQAVEDVLGQLEMVEQEENRAALGNSV